MKCVSAEFADYHCLINNFNGGKGADGVLDAAEQMFADVDRAGQADVRIFGGDLRLNVARQRIGGVFARRVLPVFRTAKTRQLDDQKKATDDLLKAVNIRNWERVEEQKNDYNASQMRNKVMMMGLLAAGAVGAIIFYKITFGIF